MPSFNTLADGTYPAVSNADGLVIETSYPRPRPSINDLGASGDDPTIDFSDATADDVLMACIFMDHDDTTETWTTPSGWTEVATGINGTTDVGYAVYYKVASGSETTVVFANSYTGDSFGIGWIIDSDIYVSVDEIEVIESIGVAGSGGGDLEMTADPADRAVTSSDGWLCFTPVYVSDDLTPVFSDQSDLQPADNVHEFVMWPSEWDALDDTVEPYDYQWSGSSDSANSRYYDLDSGQLMVSAVATLAGFNMGIGLYEGFHNNPRAAGSPMSWTVNTGSIYDTVGVTIFVNLDLPADTVSRAAIEVASTPEDDALLSRFAIYLASVPYTTGTSAITMLLPNPDQIETGSRLNEVRFPDIPSAVRGVKVSAVSGELTRRWEILLDLSTVLNVDNEPVNQDVAYDYLQSMKERHLLLPFVDNTTSVFRDEQDELTVKIDEVVRFIVDGTQYARMTLSEVINA